MNFNSYIFILLFLPLAVTGYYLTGRLQLIKGNLNLLFLFLMSLWFYAYGSIRFLPVLLGSIAFNYIIYRMLEKGHTANHSINFRKFLLFLAIAANLAMLIYFKYYNFFVDSLNLVFRSSFSIRNLLLPLGISFLTFQQIAFITDAYRKEIPDCRFLEYAVFITFFPHIMSGPILLQGDFLPLIRNEKRARIDWDRMASGVYLFAGGLAKKVLLADTFGQAADLGYGNISMLNTTSAVFVSLCYTLQIYFDFSGYSDMAIGISRMLNLDLPVNFNSPYKAKTLTEFWDRWHMTLTRFFTRYLYIPLGGNRKGKTRTWINTLIVFLCSGFWHGANWTFIAWGFLHGIGIVVTKKFHTTISRFPSWITRLFTFFFVNAAWILFRAGSFRNALNMFRILISNQWGHLQQDICTPFFVYQPEMNSPFLYPGIAVAYLIIGLWIVFRCPNLYEKASENHWSLQRSAAAILFLVLSVLSFSGVSTYVYANF